MINYNILEENLNSEAKNILLLIKADYYECISSKKKKVIDSLLESDRFVLVNQGISIFNDKTLAHGGRTLG